ncbi:hypothetical protein SprV_0602210300 [Sparganum proliferum]
MFRAPVGLVEHLRVDCSARTTPPDDLPSTSTSPLTPTINTDGTPEPPPSTAAAAATATTTNNTTTTSSTSTATAPVLTATAHNPDTPTNINLITTKISDVDSAHTSPQCDRTFTADNGLVGHMQIHRAETDKPVPEPPTYILPHMPPLSHCPRTFSHRMGLFGHTRIHESGINRSLDISPTPCATTARAYMVICAFTKICSRQLQATPHHHTLPHQHPCFTPTSPFTTIQLPPEPKAITVLKLIISEITRCRTRS